MEEARNKKCGKCKSYRYPCDFLKEGRELKTCIKCRELARQSRIKNRCSHGRRKDYCHDCGGTQICLHDKRKLECKDCNGSQICSHNKLKSCCKDCNGSRICIHEKRKDYCKTCSGNIKVIIKQWISSSRQADRKYKRYDADRFIDKCFLQGLIEDYPKCYYEDCKVKLQFDEFQDDLATIERLDNTIGHMKSNCVLCCKSCNNKRKSDYFNTELGGSSVSGGTT